MCVLKSSWLQPIEGVGEQETAGAAAPVAHRRAGQRQLHAAFDVAVSVEVDGPVHRRWLAADLAGDRRRRNRRQTQHAAIVGREGGQSEAYHGHSGAPRWRADPDIHDLTCQCLKTWMSGVPGLTMAVPAMTARCSQPCLRPRRPFHNQPNMKKREGAWTPAAAAITTSTRTGSAPPRCSGPRPPPASTGTRSRRRSSTRTPASTAAGLPAPPATPATTRSTATCSPAATTSRR